MNEDTKPRFGIIGNGSFGTALAKVLTDNQYPVNWWMRTQEAADYLQKHHHNPSYLSTVAFPPEAIRATTNLDAALKASDYVLLAIPSAYMEGVLKNIPKEALADKKVISAVKGVLPGRDDLINDYLKYNFVFDLNHYVSITGPCHAEEVAKEQLSYLTFSGLQAELTEAIAGCFANRYIKTTVNHDLWGSQYAAVLKNIYAVGAGMANGAGYGDNFLSVYITNCYREMHQFLTVQFEQLHPSKHFPDFHTSAYLGDLLVTCYSPHSRNRRLGSWIGKGYSVESAIAEMNMVAEGYFAAKGIRAILSRLDMTLPIVQQIYRILWEKETVEVGFDKIIEELD